MTRVRAIIAKDILNLEEQLNKFYQMEESFSTQVFPMENGYEALVHYKERAINQGVSKPLENKNTLPKANSMPPSPKKEVLMITDRQKKLITKARDQGYYNGEIDKLTKQEAFYVIQGLMGK